jgi:hypothetical protein
MKKKLIYICMVTVGISFASCEKIITVNPQNTIAANLALKDATGYQSVLAAVYDGLQGYGYYGRDMMLEGDALADNIYTVVAQASGRYTGANLNTSGSQLGIWTSNYSYINDCNIIIAGIPTLTGQTPANQALSAQILAQAYALRGLLYFDLARVYGWEPTDVPTTGPDAGNNNSAVLRLTAVTDLSNTQKQNRATIAQTYAQVEADFNKAITLFQAIGSTKPSQPYVFSESAAHGWLAKVYLYAGDYPNCVTQCQAALNPAICPGKLTGAGTYTAAFNASPNPESLMELDFVQNIEVTGVIGSNGAPYTYTQPTEYTSPGNGAAGIFNAALSTFGGNTPSAELLASFDSPNDDRKKMFFPSITLTTNTVYTWCNKYDGHNGPYTDNMPILRYSDVLLMEAEAMAAQAQYGPAQTLVVQLRTARNATTANVPGDVMLKQFIQDERRRELFFEGQRFFDLKRQGLGITKPALTAVGTLSPTDFRLVAPIPSGEVLFNPALPQNPNY